MGLIDVDALKKDLKSVTLSNGTLVNTNAVLHLLEEYPTAYDVDSVVEQLEELRELDACDFDNCPVEDINCCDCTQKRMAERAIEIVKAGGNS